MQWGEQGVNRDSRHGFTRDLRSSREAIPVEWVKKATAWQREKNDREKAGNISVRT